MININRVLTDQEDILMLTITESDIVLGQSAPDKTAAIALVANAMIERGLVSDGYGQGMQNREQQAATFLGNGIAIPHGTTDTRDQVKKTGVQIVQFPNGVVWGDEGQKAYIAVGIAAGSDEHLGILKQLTRVLSAENLEQQLQQASTSAEIAKLLNGKTDQALVFNTSLIETQSAARSMIELKATTAGLLSSQQAVSNAFVAEIIANDAVHLGDGLWLSNSTTGIKQSSATVVIATKPTQHDDLPLHGLITIAATADSSQLLLENLATLVYEKRLPELLSSPAEQIVSLLTSSKAPAELPANTRLFTIRNGHGLHARPSAMLVHAMKPFSCTIQVANATENSAFIDGRSLPNLMSLGLSRDQQIAVIAEGDDAEQALAAIEQAIASGLGEAVA